MIEIDAVLQTLANISVLTFILSSMLMMGFSLTPKQIIGPLKNIRLVLGALLGNFLLVPLAAYLILLLIPLETELTIGLALLATAAGAPFLPKLAQVAKGDQAFSVGLMVLLMGVTIIYVPLVLPLILGSGVSIDPLSIASSLIFLMIIPLIIGLFTSARYKSIANALRPYMAHASSLGLIFTIILIVILNWESVLSVIGTGGILTVVIFAFACLGIGFLVAGKDKKRRSVMGLGTTQRNVSAALLVATQNFSDQPNVLVMVLVGSLVTLAVLFPVAGELGKRGEKELAKEVEETFIE